MLWLALGVSLLMSVPALAISQRGHAFSFAFDLEGSSGTGISGVAVNGATGDVYVGDGQKKRVQEFEPVEAGGELVGEKYLRSFKVASPGAIAVDNCTSGAGPCSEAEDPSVGDVYVVSGSAKIEKLSEDGEPIETIKGFQAKGQKFTSISAIAVDSSGDLIVHQGVGTETSEIEKFNNATVNVGESELELPFAPRPGLAVNAGGDLYLGAEAAIGKGAAYQEQALSEAEVSFDANRESSAENFSVVGEIDGATGKPLIPALDDEFASAVAVNPINEPNNGVSERNDVYIVNVSGFGNEKTSTVAQFGPEAGAHATGEPIQRFGAPGLGDGTAIAVDSKTGAVYVADRLSGDIDVFGLEPSGPPTIEGLSAASSPTEADVDTLNAKVDPSGATSTYYFEYGTSSCSTSPCAKTSSTEIGSTFGDQEATLRLPNLEPGTYHYRVVANNAHGRVVSSEDTLSVAALLGALPDGRAWEMVSPPEKSGAEPEPIRKEGGLVQASANGEAITYVADGPMPIGSEIEGNRSPEPTQLLSTRDREPGHESWLTQDITTPNESGPGFAPGARWEYRLFSPTLALSLVDPFPAARGRFAEPPLSPLLEGEEAGKQENTIYLRDDQPLQPEGSEVSNYAQAQENGLKMTPHNPGYIALVSQLNEPGPDFGQLISEKGGIQPEGATSDMSHVVFRSETVDQSIGLYEWSEGENQLVSVLESGEPLHLGNLETYLGGSRGDTEEPNNVRHAISTNGSRVFWTYAPTASEVHLEVRETGESTSPETLELDKVRGGTGLGLRNAVFQTASADGSKVFFTDEQQLTANSHAGTFEPDLYVAELAIVGGHIAVTSLTDLTPLSGEGADILMLKGEGGGVIGASENGSYVYFVADGALTPNASRGHCASRVQAQRRAPGTTCNLYVRHYNEKTEEWEATKLIAELSYEDAPDWGVGYVGDFGFVTARTSPDGEYLAFMSDRSLTGYDNEDVSSRSAGERLDEEVYLYDAGDERLVCASCDRTGARPTGVFDAGLTSDGSGEGLGLVVDRPEIWSRDAEEGSSLQGSPQVVDHWLAGSLPGWTLGGHEYSPYQSRYLSDSGRLFFNSADALLPSGSVPGERRTRKEDVEGTELQVGVENVYEYEPGEVGDCRGSGGCVGLISSATSGSESAFLDASENGNDVFFVTAASLAQQDRDSNFDVYDAHVCESGSPCPAASTPTAACEESEQCQGTEGAYSPGAAPAQTGTAIFSGPGNLVLPKQEVLAEKTVVAPKPLTRAQKLAKALKACKKDKRKSRRLACEKQAKKKYGPAKPKPKKTGSGGKA